MAKFPRVISLIINKKKIITRAKDFHLKKKHFIKYNYIGYNNNNL